MPKRNGYHKVPHDRRYTAAAARNVDALTEHRETYLVEKADGTKAVVSLDVAKHKLGVRASDKGFDKRIAAHLEAWA